MTDVHITAGMFHRFVEVQMRGIVNMQDDGMVAILAAIPLESVKAIRDNYDRCLEKYGEHDASSS